MHDIQYEVPLHWDRGISGCKRTHTTRWVMLWFARHTREGYKKVEFEPWEARKLLRNVVVYLGYNPRPCHTRLLTTPFTMSDNESMCYENTYLFSAHKRDHRNTLGQHIFMRSSFFLLQSPVHTSLLGCKKENQTPWVGFEPTTSRPSRERVLGS
jgi:hypothetical protein